MLNLKSIPIIWLVGLHPLQAQDSIPQWDVEIPGPLANGRRAEPTPQPEPINFKVLTSHTRRVDVTEASEMSDLPPIKGTINVTVETVEDPGLPDPPPPLPATVPDDPAVISQMEELREKYRGSELIFLSATVYDHSRTLLRIYPNGKAGGQISAWTNIDFNHFCGFSTYRVKEADGTSSDRSLLMGIGNTDTYETKRILAKSKQDNPEPEIPEIPDLSVKGPSFVVIEGETKGEAMDTLTQMHDLYRKEGVRMEAAYHARERAHAGRKAYLLANPPIPEDVVIRFWKPKKCMQPNPQQEVGAP